MKYPPNKLCETSGHLHVLVGVPTIPTTTWKRVTTQTKVQVERKPAHVLASHQTDHQCAWSLLASLPPEVQVARPAAVGTKKRGAIIFQRYGLSGWRKPRRFGRCLPLA